MDHPWTEAGKSILRDIINNVEVLTRRHLFPTQIGPVADRSHLSHYSILDVGNDGVPLPILIASERSPPSRTVDIWRRISSMNADPARQKQAVGRITIVREPSPLLYAALHYTMKDHFDMDRIFEMLEANNKTKAFPHILGQIPRHTAIRSSSRLNILQSSATNAYPRNGRSQMKCGGRPKPMYL